MFLGIIIGVIIFVFGMLWLLLTLADISAWFILVFFIVALAVMGTVMILSVGGKL